MKLENAVDEALEEMPDDFTIKNFLVENKEEVKSMIINEFNEQMIIDQETSEGKNEGRISMLVKLVNKGRISEEIAAEEAKLSVDEFRIQMNRKREF